MYLKIVFLVSAILMTMMLLFYKLYLQKRKRTEKTAEYISVLVFVFVLYVMSAVLCAIFIPGIMNKVLMMFFAISPFIIGKMATYEKETFYSYIQIFCLVVSIFYVWYFGL